MKSKLLSILVFIASLGTLTSCEKDKAPDVVKENLNGVYLGDLDIMLGSVEVGKDVPQKIYITTTGDDVMKMELKNFSFDGLSLGDIVVENIKVVVADGKSSFTGAQKIKLVIGECDVNVVGFIQDGKCDMDIAVKTSVGDVKVDFVGTKMDADKSSEALITAFTIDSPLVIKAPVIDGKTIQIIFSSTATSEQVKTLVPTIVISKDATITPASGVAMDFTNPVVYTVISQDGITKNNYTVSLEKSGKYNFEEWVGEGDGSNLDYQMPLAWATSNPGVILISAIFPHLYAGGPIVKEGVGAVSKGVVITTANTTGAAATIFPAIPNITSGSLFKGVFIVDMANTLKSTKFGDPCLKKPLSVKGVFKYTAGEEYRHCADPANASHIAVVDASKKDQCAMSAVLYEVTSFYENENNDEKKYSEHLTGVNIFTSDKIVAIAQQFSSDTADFTNFELVMDYKKEYDSSKKYRLAIIFSSSKDGDKFSGASNSTLTIDEVEIVSE